MVIWCCVLTLESGVCVFVDIFVVSFCYFSFICFIKKRVIRNIWEKGSFPLPFPSFADVTKGFTKELPPPLTLPLPLPFPSLADVTNPLH